MSDRKMLPARPIKKKKEVIYPFKQLTTKEKYNLNMKKLEKFQKANPTLEIADFCGNQKDAFIHFKQNFSIKRTLEKYNETVIRVKQEEKEKRKLQKLIRRGNELIQQPLTGPKGLNEEPSIFARKFHLNKS